VDLSDDGQRAAWRARLEELFRGRRVICALAPLAGWTDTVALLAEAGAARPLLLASAVGAGPVPGPDDAEIVMVDVPVAPTLTDEVRQQEHEVRHLSAEVVTAVEAYDPGRTAVWLVSPFISTAPLLGREVLGGRPAAWFALEDKLLADDVWDAVGVPRAPSRVVPVDADALAAASAELDAGAGVVWAGDAREGFNGGGDFVRWVVDEPDAAAARAFFAAHCDRVRVMPFLDGVPCSIHGIVLPDGTATFRPVELAVLRGAGRRFVYGGLGTTWDPPDPDRAAMREIARRTGEHLRGLVGYRGAFGIDGILGVDGFRPTELNSRMSAGISTMARVVDGAAFSLLQHTLVAGGDPGVDVATLEAWAVPAMDATRFAKAIAVSTRSVAPEPRDLPVTWDGTHLALSAEPTGMCVSVGPNAAGTFCRLVTTPDAALPARVETLNAALLRFLDGELDTGFGEVHVAPDVRRAAPSSA
jgi:hypothetical protein